MNAMEKRAEFLAEKLGLSLQLTTIWVKQNPDKSRRPMEASAVRDLKDFAELTPKISADE